MTGPAVQPPRRRCTGVVPWGRAEPTGHLCLPCDMPQCACRPELLLSLLAPMCDSSTAPLLPTPRLAYDNGASANSTCDSPCWPLPSEGCRRSRRFCSCQRAHMQHRRAAHVKPSNCAGRLNNCVHGWLFTRHSVLPGRSGSGMCSGARHCRGNAVPRMSRLLIQPFGRAAWDPRTLLAGPAGPCYGSLQDCTCFQLSQAGRAAAQHRGEPRGLAAARVGARRARRRAR